MTEQTIKEITREVKRYSIECKCGKEITGISIEVCLDNLQRHIASDNCKGDKNETANKR